MYTLNMIELAAECLDTTLIRTAIWINTMHWFNIIVNMDEKKDERR